MTEEYELTYKDKLLRNINYILIGILIVQIVLNWDKILSFLEWITNL